jgi:hypothetical protein
MDRFSAAPGERGMLEPGQETAMGNDDNHDLPPMAERRPKMRKRVLLTGIIAYDEGAHSFHCTIRNLSESGARLAVTDNALFPSDFYLINVRDRVAYDAKLVWNKRSEIGVTFKATIPLASITDPALAFLKRLWLAKA